MISLIVAASENGVIGAQGELPWRLPADLERFKALTMGKPIVMGRLTHESIGRALPGRQNIVITRQSGYTAKGCDVASTIDDALAAAGDADEIMIIGGAEIYRQSLPSAGRIYLTRVHVDIDGDAHFAALNDAEWREVSVEPHVADDMNEYDYSFFVLERRS